MVMSGGRPQGVLSREEATPQAVMALAVRNTFIDDADHVDRDTTEMETAGARQEG
jgi:hypothetical protein